MQMPTPDAAILARRAAIVARLRAVIGAGDVIDDPVEARAYECDGLTAYKCPPLAVVLPSTTAEVAAVMAACRETGVPLTPRGAGTSIAGNAVGPGVDSRVDDRPASGVADEHHPLQAPGAEPVEVGRVEPPARFTVRDRIEGDHPERQVVDD